MPFVIRTIILYTIGIEYVGLGGLFGSLINVLNITELGFGGAISYILYKPVAENDNQKVCAILNFARKCFWIIGLVVTIIGIVILPFLSFFVHGNYPDNLNIVLLYMFYLANSIISYVMFSYKRILFAAVQRYDIETKISSITIILQYLLQVLVLVIFKNYYVYVLMIPIATILNNLICGIVTNQKYPHFKACGHVTKQEIEIIKQKVGGAFFSKLGATVFLSVDNIIISSFFGLTILGKYSNYYMIITMLLSVFAIIHNTLRPIIGNCIVTDTKEKNYTLLKHLYFIYMWMAAACACFMLCLYQDFISVWSGEQNLLTFNMVILFTIYWYTERVISLPIVYVEAAGYWWEVRYVTLIEAIVNLTLNITLSKMIGLSGILLSTIISVISVAIIGYLRVLFKKYFGKCKLKDFLKYIFDICIRTICTIAIVWLVIYRVNAFNWEILILKGCVTAILFIIIGLFLNIKNENAIESVKFMYQIFVGGKQK